MRSRSDSDLQDRAANLGTDFVAVPHDLAIESGGATLQQEQRAGAILADLPATTSEDGSTSGWASLGDSTSASPFALLDTQAEAGHSATNSPLAEMADASPGSGSINVIGTMLPEANAGLHIAPPIDSGFAATTGTLFAPSASAPTPIVALSLADLTTMSFTGHGAETPFAHVASQASPDTGSATGTQGAVTAGLAFLENSPIADAGVGSGGATAAQVRAALDESGLSVNGSGIKVGVLSDSFNDLGGAAADEANGALPSTVQVLKDLGSGGTDEGRAMMQIIHDIAPGASLAFYTAFNSEQDFANGILALANAGAKVIVDDVGYFDEPFFQNGVVAQAIQTVEAAGVTYVTAAGNEGGNGYQAAWTPISGTFDGVSLTDAESFGGSLTQTITVNNEGTGIAIPLVLEWNQAYGAATSDLEILVFHNGSLVDTATNRTSGESTNPWIEYDFAGSGTYQIAVENLSGPNPGLIKEITWGDGLPATISGANAGTVVGHAMTPGAITAGAVSAADTPAFGFTPTSESFSSSGAGTELLFANNGTPLSSPQLLSPVAVSGIDDIATTVPGGLSDFFGTSASSASLAGVAALMLSADPNLTPAEVETIMEQTALSMGNSAVAGAGLVQVKPAVAAALAMITTVVESHGVTSLVQAGSDYFLNPAGGTGPELTFGGAPVTVGLWAGWNPVGAEQTSNGYDVAFYNASLGQFNIWSTDSSGHYITNLASGISATSSTLENFETIFQQDLNNDGTIGVPPPPPPPPPSVVEHSGATALLQAGGDYFLNPVSNLTTVTGPELTFGGSPVTVGMWAGWNPVGAEQTSTGYDVAFYNASTGTFNIWSTDSGGHYTANLASGISATSATLENFETTFQQDLNGDGTIGPPGSSPPPPPPSGTVIEHSGVTALIQSGSDYFLNPVSSGTTITGPELTFGGSPVTVGMWAGWNPVGAEQTSTGYDVAFYNASSATFNIWSTDSSGHYTANLASGISATSSTLENFETTFQQDLNNDGHVGPPPPPPPSVVEHSGATALLQAGGDYFLNPVSNLTTITGPELTFNGSPVTVGMWAGWNPVGAEKTSTGYDVAFYNASLGQFNIWSTDNNGNYITNLASGISGTSSTLISFETIFQQDLNGNGTIGNSVSSQVASNPTPDNFHFAGDSSGTPQAIAFSVHPSSAAGQSATAPGSAAVMTEHDSFVFALDSGPSNSNVAPATDASHGNTSFANLHALLTGPHEDAFSNPATHDAVHGAQWPAHHDFHLI